MVYTLVEPAGDVYALPGDRMDASEWVRVFLQTGGMQHLLGLLGRDRDSDNDNGIDPSQVTSARSLFVQVGIPRGTCGVIRKGNLNRIIKLMFFIIFFIGVGKDIISLYVFVVLGRTLSWLFIEARSEICFPVGSRSGPVRRETPDPMLTLVRL